MIISIINEKGGSGKTTLSINLAIRLALDGDSVLLIDTDPQNSTEIFCQKRRENSQKSLFEISHDIKEIKSGFDSVIIDTGGRDSKEMREAILNSHATIMPTISSPFDIAALKYMCEIIEKAKEFNKNLLAFIAINRATTNIFLRQELSEFQNEISKIIDGRKDFFLLKNMIFERISYKRAVFAGFGISEFGDEKAKGEFERVYREFENLVKNNIKRG